MRPAVAALGAAFVVGILAFFAVVAHVVLTGVPQVTDIAIAVAACLVVCATAMLAIRRRPRIDDISTQADVYEMALEQVSADR